MTQRAIRPDLSFILADDRRRSLNAILTTIAATAAIGSAFVYAGAFDPRRYADALPTMLQLAADAVPPDFSRWPKWGQPLLETLSMSIAGTVLGILAALPFGTLAARNIAPQPWLGGPVRLFLSILRSVPGLIWGVIFVAAVGFGPLPGILALASHSTGMMGKFFAETMEHVDPGPGDALRSCGVSRLGVLRFSVLPQILPRLVDVAVYRWEHNLRAATTLGLVGAGGLGLEIVTAFHLFEYREASALIIVLLGTRDRNQPDRSPYPRPPAEKSLTPARRAPARRKDGRETPSQLSDFLFIEGHRLAVDAAHKPAHPQGRDAPFMSRCKLAITSSMSRTRSLLTGNTFSLWTRTAARSLRPRVNNTEHPFNASTRSVKGSRPVPSSLPISSMAQPPSLPRPPPGPFLPPGRKWTTSTNSEESQATS